MRYLQIRTSADSLFTRARRCRMLYSTSQSCRKPQQPLLLYTRLQQEFRQHFFTIVISHMPCICTTQQVRTYCMYMCHWPRSLTFGLWDASFIHTLNAVLLNAWSSYAVLNTQLTPVTWLGSSEHNDGLQAQDIFSASYISTENLLVDH